ncbi:MAG: DUF1292 domain-containing protein [Lachnospiraceae bacterium]|nr:DUF1292 domain-containing protein [Lachnospiraceae bacterium]
MEKIILNPDNEDRIEFFVLEQTTVAGVNYLLVTDSEEGDGEALILKDKSKKEDTEAVYEIVSDDKELKALADIFENLLDDVQFVSDDE